MGVEYRHFVVVNDKDWLPAVDTLARVDAVLYKWSLIDKPTMVFDLSTMKESSEKSIPNSMPGAGQVLVYDEVANGKPVVNIAGRCYYDTVKDEDHYISSIIVVAGNDIRIQQSDEYCYFEQTSPAPDQVCDGFMSDLDTIPWPVSKTFDAYLVHGKYLGTPKVNIHFSKNFPGLYEWTNYAGYWRGAVMLDFGKSLPNFCENLRQLPARDFVNELATAFRGPIAEIGVVY
ncbi:hypothetical protein [Undibacterium pigrum]|uniref:Uncharacterized protein n=1 Tax=Undibacterium pigrum TaxID=401470 RepID=A0A318IP02_9BURK|nr:hypothetical protein [Undibacterium pigrum]PXX33710.1 hypothetical protein DFR42_1296 [Undibacterium pigrum]